MVEEFRKAVADAVKGSTDNYVATVVIVVTFEDDLPTEVEFNQVQDVLRGVGGIVFCRGFRNGPSIKDYGR